MLQNLLCALHSFGDLEAEKQQSFWQDPENGSGDLQWHIKSAVRFLRMAL